MEFGILAIIVIFITVVLMLYNYSSSREEEWQNKFDNFKVEVKHYIDTKTFI